MRYKIDIIKKEFRKKDYKEFILSGDIGGTNARIAVCAIKKKKEIYKYKFQQELLFVFEFKTKDIKDICDIILEVMNHSSEYGISFDKVCIGGAGIVKDNVCRLTNNSLVISAKRLKSRFRFKETVILNDIELIGYGLNIGEGFFKINNLKTKKDLNKAVVTAGTGLGKCLCRVENEVYVPSASEGGHSDLSFRVSELDLMKFLSKKEKYPLRYESVVSGKAIENMYKFYSKGKSRAISDIFLMKDTASKKTIIAFYKFLSRAAKNYFLETLSLGGVYLAGGIVQKNVDKISQDIKKIFMKEFLDSKRKDLLKDVPVFVIDDPYISLKGGCFRMMCY